MILVENFEIDIFVGKKKRRRMGVKGLFGDNFYLKNKMSYKFIFFWGKNMRKNSRFCSIKGR